VSKFLLKPVLIGGVVGAVVGFALLYVSASAVSGSSGNTAIAQALFPYALAADPTLLNSPWIVLSLALLQYPFYGTLLGVAWTRTRRRAIALVACIAFMVAGHLGAVRLAHGSAFDVKVESVVFSHADEMVTGEGFMVLADRRIFAVMAFLNAVGYDDEAQGQQMHPVRIKVRQMVAANLAKSPEKLQAWRKYYQSKTFKNYHFQDWALSLSADYPFKRIRPNNELQYILTALMLNDLPEILNDFWVTSNLEQVWNAVKPDYIAELKKYNFEKMKRQVSFLWEYLRMKRSDAYVIVHVPDPLDRHFNAIGARYENYYYAVESPGASAYDLNVHEYLHSIVNPLVKTNYEKYKSKLGAYYQAGRGGPLFQYYQDLETFIYECLVRALDHRLRVKLEARDAVTKQVEAQIADITRQGLTLTRPFYVLLEDYEKSGKRFDEFMPLLFDALPKSGP